MKEYNQLIQSDDGAHTLISSQFGVSYHSTHGALIESITVFLTAGLQFARDRYASPIRILEMGFGTGLNALLTLIESQHYRLPVEYTTLEAYPIDIEEAKKLNYIQILKADRYREAFIKMHNINHDEVLPLDKYFTFKKMIQQIQSHQPIKRYDLVYYDAFAPTTQPELWDDSMMARVYSMMSDQSVLVSYCAKGSFKRALRAAGFTVEGLPGPPGKREMTRAIKSL